MGIEVKSLGTFEKKLIQKATEQLPRESYRIMRKMGSKARTLAAKNGRKMIKKNTGNYNKGWKRGKAFRRGKEYMIYVKNLAPHAHLIERGHRIVDKNGNEHGFQKGKFVLEKSMEEFESTMMEQMLDEWLDDLLEKGL